MALVATRSDRTDGAGSLLRACPVFAYRAFLGPKISLKISVRFLLT